MFPNVLRKEYGIEFVARTVTTYTGTVCVAWAPSTYIPPKSDPPEPPAPPGIPSPPSGGAGGVCPEGTSPVTYTVYVGPQPYRAEWAHMTQTITQCVS